MCISNNTYGYDGHRISSQEGPTFKATHNTCDGMV